MNFEQAIVQIQDTLTVMVGIQDRQARVQKLQAEELDAMRTMLLESVRTSREQFAIHERRMAKFDEKMLEIEEKLNGLIGYMDGMQKPPTQ